MIFKWISLIIFFPSITLIYLISLGLRLDDQEFLAQVVIPHRRTDVQRVERFVHHELFEADSLVRVFREQSSEQVCALGGNLSRNLDFVLVALQLLDDLVDIILVLQALVEELLSKKYPVEDTPQTPHVALVVVAH